MIKNIIDNSVAYNNQNGKLIIELSKNNLTISDTGVGISKEDLEHIFERFYRVDKARSRESSGTGLGLSLVKAIMLQHKNNFGANNLENGVEFWFELDADA